MASRRWIGLQPKYLQLTPLPAAQSVGIVKRPSLNSRLALSTLAHTVISGLLAAPGGLDNQCHVPAAALHYRFNMTRPSGTIPASYGISHHSAAYSPKTSLCLEGATGTRERRTHQARYERRKGLAATNDARALS